MLQNNQHLVKSHLSAGTHFFEETSGLGSILSESEVQGVFKENGGLFWNSLSVFWVYLYQKIHGVSCSGAVTVFISSLVKMGRQFPSSCTSNFCTNRAKLAVKAIQKLRNLVYEKLLQKVSPENRWHGHDVFYVDGTTVSLDDTPANQAQFPQSSSQKDGLGFPLIRAVFVFSMLTAMVKAAGFAPYQGKGTGEAALLRSLLDSFKSGDIIVADRLYCTYMLIALLLNRDIFVCVRCNESRRKRNQKILFPNRIYFGV